MESEDLHDADVLIRPARKNDMSAVASLIQELADFQNMPDGPKMNATDLQRDGFDTTPPAFLLLVAQKKTNNAIVGYALYFATYSTWEGRAMMLEDLYVKPALRKQGIGRRLFNAVAKEAALARCSRLDFHVLEWNEARSFYESIGAVNLTKTEQWCLYRLTGDAFQKAAS
ncbi:thialysine N-epsilon-acetyltransferase-like [Leguminivora glycinivorella]|uniref:thialysine N-epsilon-acetyltransferase-like n=1 Tax=Leguminivora glycinivorella TaxID=1035111 RepID=UPI00200E3D60|nr:thialysine N-epsilon-acetyltransferase-like [Leguminivora glycinivorella]